MGKVNKDYDNFIEGFSKAKSTYTSNAKARGIPFNLKDEELNYLFQQPCEYCGTLPETRSIAIGIRGGKPPRYLSITYNGIDRIDSSKNYSMDNVVSCCSFCNYAKHTHSMYEFLKRISQIYEYQHFRANI